MNLSTSVYNLFMFDLRNIYQVISSVMVSRTNCIYFNNPKLLTLAYFPYLNHKGYNEITSSMLYYTIGFLDPIFIYYITRRNIYA